MSALDASNGTDERQPTRSELEMQEGRRQAERRAARLGISAKKTNDAAAGIPFSPDPTLGTGNEPVDTGLGAAVSAKQPQAEAIKREEPPGVQPGPNAGQSKGNGTSPPPPNALSGNTNASIEFLQERAATQEVAARC
jgi:hypothetical protein